MTICRERHRDAAGFTLLELLVAFAIAAGTLAALFQLFAGSLDRIGDAGAYTRAVLLARARLDRVGVEDPLVPGTRTGAFDNQYGWRVMITPYRPAGDAATPALVPFAVAVTVSWREGGRERAVSLDSLRLAATRRAE